MAGRFTLRALVSEARQRAFSYGHGVADIIVEDPLLQERMHQILAQIVLEQALYIILLNSDYPQPIELSAHFDIPWMIRRAKEQGLISKREARELHAINREANQAKHELGFRPRL